MTLSQAERQEGAARLPAMRRRLQAMSLPSSPLDSLIGLLGGPGRVAEMTGRKKRREWLAAGEHGGEQAGDEQPSSGRWGSALVSKADNMSEKDAYLSGEKLVAVISEAASTGISLHAVRLPTREASA